MSYQFIPIISCSLLLLKGIDLKQHQQRYMNSGRSESEPSGKGGKKHQRLTVLTRLIPQQYESAVVRKMHTVVV